MALFYEFTVKIEQQLVLVQSQPGIASRQFANVPYFS